MFPFLSSPLATRLASSSSDHHRCKASFGRPLWAAALALLAASAPAWGTSNPVGGGYLHAGLPGRYYANPDLTGEPVFERRDIRLDFDWGSFMKPGGGLRGTQLASLAADDYSVRWEGQIMARFSEDYTFKAYADSVRIWIKPASQPDYPATPQIDYWPANEPGSYDPKTTIVTMTAGEACDIKVEYRERTGPAQMRLLWSAPSVPEEVIQPTAYVGMVPPGRTTASANAMWSADNWGDLDGVEDGELVRDADGWPAEDFGFLIRPQDETINPGTYLLQFQGTARVYVNLVSGETFRSADGTVDYGVELNPGEGYDAPTNTTTARMIIAPGSDNCWPRFYQSDRDGPGSVYGENTGLTGLMLMRPTAPGGSEPHRLDELFARDAIASCSRFVSFRWNDVNSDGAVEWTDRQTLDGQGGLGNLNDEFKILWCNQVGRDMWIQVPHRASDDYITKMALLLRYGSDASYVPYTSPQADPFHPPLNPNLRISVEYTNECPWNSAGQYPQASWVISKATSEVNGNTPTGQILNYDGANLSGMALGSRYFGLRTKEISDLFRAVWGDANMTEPGRRDPRVRPVLMYQYDNYNQTAQRALHFLDNYFNKTDPASPYAGTPRPVSYYLFGGGGAAYYASEDRNGIDDLATFNLPVVDGSPLGVGAFEQLLLNPGEARIGPSGSPWTFTGSAGLYRRAARAAATAGAIGATSTSVDSYTYRGCKFTVGPQDIAVYEVGRYLHPGNSSTHVVSIYEADGAYKRLVFIEVPSTGATAGDFVYRQTGIVNNSASKKFFSYPVILQAGKSYFLVSGETDGGDAHATSAEIVPPTGLVIDGTAKGWNNSDVWTWEVGAVSNRAFGPVNMKFAVAPIQDTGAGFVLGYVQDSKEDRDNQMKSNNPEDYSEHAAFLAGTAEMEAEVVFPQAGLYGFVYHLAYKRDQQPYLDTDGDGKTDDENLTNPPRFYLVEDGVEIDISPSGQTDTRVGTSDYDGYWTKPGSGYDYFGSAPFTIVDPGKTYRLRIKGTKASTDNVVLIDNILVASARRMMEGVIPYGGGFAEGQPDISNWEAERRSEYKYAQAFGLHGMMYEGGWYPGGDANKMPLQYEAAYTDPKVKVGEMLAVDIFARIGLAVAGDFTRNYAMPDWDLINSSNYQRIQAWDEVAARLPVEADNGLPLGSTFTSASQWWQEGNGDSAMVAGEWFSWNVIAPRTGAYELRFDGTVGGQFKIEIDGLTVFSGASGPLLEMPSPISLTKGLHAIRLVAVNGSFTLSSLAGAEDGQAYGLNGLTGTGGNTTALLRWPAQAGAEGYHVYYRQFNDSTWTRANASLLPPATADADYYLTGLENDVTYEVAVTFVLAGAESAFSNAIKFATDSGAPIIYWEFDSSLSKTAVPSNYTGPGMLTSIITKGAGLNTTSNSAYQNDAFGVSGVNTTTLDGAVTNNDYFSVTVEPQPGSVASLSGLMFGAFTQFSYNEINYVVRYSTDQFATFTEMNNNSPANPLTGLKLTLGNARPVTLDLSGESALQGFTGPVQFRLYLFGNGQSGSGGNGIGKLGEETIDMAFYGSCIIHPVITAQPQSAVVKELSAASLSVTASGIGLTYQWQRATIGGSDWVSLSGANSSVLSFTTVTPAEEKDYRVIVTDSNQNSVTSDTATWTVDRVPTITTAELPPATAGEVYVHVLQAVSGTGALSWTISSGALPPGLSMNSAGVISGTPEAGGSFGFNARATDANDDFDDASLELAVDLPPVFTQQPQGQTRYAGEDVLLTASASGLPAPTYQWQKDGVDLAGATSPTLLIDGVGSADVATYTVSATNRAGSVVSSGALLQVILDQSIPGLLGANLGNSAVAVSYLNPNGDIEQVSDASGLTSDESAPRDKLLFDYQTVSGDFEAVVNLKSLQGGSPARVALMMREDEDGNAAPDNGDAYVCLGSGLGGGYFQRLRSARDVGAEPEMESLAGGQPFTHAWPDKWVMLRREAGTLSLAVSTDDATYQEVDVSDYDVTGLSPNVLVGIATWQGASSILAVSQTNSFSVTPVNPTFGRWNFDEDVSDTATGGTANPAVLVNSPTYSTADRMVGSACLALTAANKQHASVANHADLNPTSAITIAAWVRPYDLVNYRRVLQKGSQNQQYRIEINGNGGGKFALKVGGVAKELVIPAGSFTANVWQHVAGVYDGATIRFYVNGLEVGSPISVTGAIATTTASLLIGAKTANDSVTTSYWNGLLDDLRIYHNALSPAAIQYLAEGHE